MISEQVQQQHSLRQFPAIYWLIIALFVAALYIVVLMQLDASRAKVLQFRDTSETQMMSLASNSGTYQKPSAFGKPVRASRGTRTAVRKSAPTFATALSGISSTD